VQAATAHHFEEVISRESPHGCTSTITTVFYLKAKNAGIVSNVLTPVPGINS